MPTQSDAMTFTTTPPDRRPTAELGADLVVGGTYSGSPLATKSFSGLVVGGRYFFDKGNSTALFTAMSDGRTALLASGMFVAGATYGYVSGTNGATVTATVKPVGAVPTTVSPEVIGPIPTFLATPLAKLVGTTPFRQLSVDAGGVSEPETGVANLGTTAATHIVGTGTSTRIQRNMARVDRVKIYVASVTNVTELRVSILRYIAPKMYVVGRSENFIGRVTAGAINTIELTSAIPNVKLGDYICVSIAASGGGGNYLRSVTKATQSLWVVDSAELVDGTVQVGAGSFVSNTALPVKVYGPQADLIGAGDSLMSGEAASASLRDSKTDAAYTGLDMLKGLRESGWSVMNMGIGGETSTSLLARWQADVLDQKPLAVAVHSGGNDIGGISDLADLDDAKNTAIGNLQEMLDSAFSLGIKLIVVGILPRTSWCTEELYDISRARREINTALRGLVDSRYVGHALYLDPDPVVGSLYADGDAGNLDALNPTYAHTDDVHLNVAGQAAMSGAMIALCETYLF